VNVHAGDVVFYACLIVSVILHEISHGVVALWCGDDTAKRAGRLTLDPRPHIDPVGSVLLPGLMVLSGAPAFGWAKPVPVNPSRLRRPRQQMLWVGLVGPGTNFTIMMIAACVFRFFHASLNLGPFVEGRFTLGPAPLAFVVVISFAYANLFLGVFNLLPIPPLDGSSLIERILPRTSLPTWYRVRQYGFLILFAAVFLFHLLDHIIDPFLRLLVHFMGG
jgi:Zn-dependent protease